MLAWIVDFLRAGYGFGMSREVCLLELIVRKDPKLSITGSQVWGGLSFRIQATDSSQLAHG
jgi:hypothetical protein